MLPERINKWFSTFGKSLFLYKKGFFELPYLANSPQAIIESVIKMRRFVQHSAVRQTINVKSLFLDGITYYQEIEEGLWLMQADYEYKKNVSMRRVDDKKLPSDYYSIRLSITKREIGKLSLVNGMFYSNYTWILFKPNADSLFYHFKGAKERTFTVFFSEQWLQDVLCNTPGYKSSNIKYFFESTDARHIIWPETIESVESLFPIVDLFQEKTEKGVIDLQKFKELTMKFINLFIDKYTRDDISKHFFEIPDADRLKILKAERMLVENIQGPFIGIEGLSKQVSISPTQLKSYFKLIFGDTVFQYFRQKQMEYAYAVLKNKTNTIKEVAQQLGYENASKFTAAFKEQYKVLPSEV